MLRTLSDYKGGIPNPTNLCKVPEARKDMGVFGELRMEYLDVAEV